jgi:hypothetical protein
MPKLRQIDDVPEVQVAVRLGGSACAWDRPAARSASMIWRMKLLVEGAWAARAGLLMGTPDSTVKPPSGPLPETYGTDAPRNFGVSSPY